MNKYVNMMTGVLVIVFMFGCSVTVKNISPEPNTLSRGIQISRTLQIDFDEKIIENYVAYSKEGLKPIKFKSLRTDMKHAAKIAFKDTFSNVEFLDEVKRNSHAVLLKIYISELTSLKIGQTIDFSRCLTPDCRLEFIPHIGIKIKYKAYLIDRLSSLTSRKGNIVSSTNSFTHKKSISMIAERAIELLYEDMFLMFTRPVLRKLQN